MSRLSTRRSRVERRGRVYAKVCYISLERLKDKNEADYSLGRIKKFKSNLMALCVSVAKPKFRSDPVVLVVVGGIYRVAFTGNLIQLDGDRHNIAIVSDEEKTYGGCDVAHIFIFRITGNAIKNLVVNHVNVSCL